MQHLKVTLQPGTHSQQVVGLAFSLGLVAEVDSSETTIRVFSGETPINSVDFGSFRNLEGVADAVFLDREAAASGAITWHPEKKPQKPGTKGWS